MNRQIKRLLLTELSSKRKLAKSLNVDLPVIAQRTRSKDNNDNVKSFYRLTFDEHNIIFHFDTWVKFDDNFQLTEMQTYGDIDDLKHDLKLSESWFEPFVNEE